MLIYDSIPGNDALLCLAYTRHIAVTKHDNIDRVITDHATTEHCITDHSGHHAIFMFPSAVVNYALANYQMRLYNIYRLQCII